MRPRLARILRRRTHRPIPGMDQSVVTGIELANRAIRHGQIAGAASSGLLETFAPPPAWHTRIAAGLAGVTPALPNAAPAKKPLGIRARLADWLDHNDYGYPIGLLLYLGGVLALCFQAWWIAVPLIITAFVVCWWFG